MFNTVSDSFRWLLTLGGKFFRVAPGATLFVIPATLVSQVAMLLAFLLPLKVLILIGSDRIPRYLSQDFIEVDRNTLILALSIATPAFYIIHLVMERLVQWASNMGAKQLLERSRKIILFENQDDLAASSYQRYALALANTVFIGCVWLALGFLFPPLCVLLIGFTTLCVIFLALAHKSSKSLRERIDDNLTSIVPVLTGLGFMLAFLLLVQQFLSGAVQGFLVAIISVILTRQALNRTNKLVSSGVSLYSNRRKLNAMFFAEHSLTQVDDKQTEFWSLFASETRQTWLHPLLREQLAIDPANLNVTWHQTGASEVIALEAEAYNSENELIGSYLVRVYGKNPSLPASHEATLLLDESSTRLPALPLLAAGQVGKWPCHIYSLPQGCSSVAPGKHTQNYLTALFAFEPPNDLAERYARSHPMLWQRLDSTVLERLNMAADESTLPIVQSLEQQLPSMLETVRNLPLIIVNSTINSNTLLVDAEEQLWITDWGRWTLEPLGSNWPLTLKSLQDLPHALQQASLRRSALQSVKAKDVTLAALLFQFDRLCTQQVYLDALAFIPKLLEAQE
ncbi:hypothetical protein QWI17_16050 [Gilvimarinus sp. SDUM040013]|uniref:ABC transmembrane type-1 domain-containing protein n=1 Tax=Gilvimarinus gilvus TaxID=3058038 RepID=A0ABU4RVZ5_9GAMM|nr:hypothetical protein [Gilvimarinus sp. SDUM040013]MDO3387354.1 hypothetical protein [Gilvimarinus sp. SDUM040013]MDX6849043.1 hypothetical protein [Gilvimarinus sp. SDUM040013]